jgi:hypothetical protein
MGERERIVVELRSVIDEIEEFEAQFQALEKGAGLPGFYRSKPITERMAHLGMSQEAIDVVDSSSMPWKRLALARRALVLEREAPEPSLVAAISIDQVDAPDAASAVVDVVIVVLPVARYPGEIGAAQDELHGLHLLRDRRRRRAAQLEGTIAARELDRGPAVARSGPEGGLTLLAAGIPGVRPGKNGRSRAVDFRPLVLKHLHRSISREIPSTVSTANMAAPRPS